MKFLNKTIAVTALSTLGVSALCWATPSKAGVSLTNPAAEHCIEEGGFFGIREGDDGKRGVCILEGGEEIDAWAYLQAHLKNEAGMSKAKIANPAAKYCEAISGAYNLKTSSCLLPDGAEVDAWASLREAHAAAASLGNPAATHCIEMGGAYEIRDGDNGQSGICKLPNGDQIDAWVLFRKSN